MPAYGYEPHDLKQLRETGIDPHDAKADTWYDYTNQAWVVNGVYQRCGHPENMNCGCYGQAHEGEMPAQTIIEQYGNVQARSLTVGCYGTGRGTIRSGNIFGAKRKKTKKRKVRKHAKTA